MTFSITRFLPLVFILFVGILAYQLQSPPHVVPSDAPLDEFSAERAFQHLQTVARAPHSGGTTEHAKVRRYIVDYCQEMGLEVEIQDTLALRSGRNTVVSNVKNIIARLSGTQSGRSILIVSHYDSQPNTYGASDDGAAVIAMLETIRALKNQPQLTNDVIFLFTDQEEVGLLGAEAFVNLHPVMKEVELVLNYESRGNQGVAFCFEVSNQNGWIVRQFAVAAAHPFANSMAYEVYKLMPNDTDFTLFRGKEITGLNQANVDGYVNYHSMNDTPENLDLRIVQHHGDNMLSMLQHLGHQDIDYTKAPDINYFNPIGSWLIHYPSSWSIPLMILCFMLFIWNIFLGLKAHKITIKNVLWGFLIFPLATIVVGLSSMLLIKVVLWTNPHFTNYYSSNFYNAKWYLLSLMGLWLVINGLIYRKFWKRIGSSALVLGAVLFMMILMLGTHLIMPTATFVLYYPLCWFLFFNGFDMRMRVSIKWLSSLGPLAALGLWVPLASMLFVVFSLQLPIAAVAMLCLLWGLLIPSVAHVEALRYSPLVIVGGVLLFIGLTVGQWTAGYSTEQPLQTSLTYVLDQGTGAAAWISTNEHKDHWNSTYLNHPEKEPFKELYSGWNIWRGDAKAIEIPPSRILITEDTIIGSHRHLNVSIIPQRDLIGVELRFAEQHTFAALIINGREVPADTKHLMVQAIDQKLSMDIKYEGEQIAFQLVERDLGIPPALLEVPLPPEYIFGPGPFSNAVFTTKQVVL